MNYYIREFYFFIIVICLLGIFLFVRTAQGDFSPIVISEIGASEVSDMEWIEIVNRSGEAVDMEGWKFFEDGANHKLTLVSGTSTIPAGGYAVIAKDASAVTSTYDLDCAVFDSSWGALNNDGEEIGLKDSGDNIVESFVYLATEDFSLERRDILSNIYTAENWTEHPDGNTIGQANYWQGSISIEEEHEPVALFSYTVSSSTVFFDASYSTDEDGDIIFYAWNFGDGESEEGVTTTHTYTISTTTVELIVTDASLLESSTSTIITLDIFPEEDGEIEEVVTSTAHSIILSEIYSNQDPDTLEWIELYNVSSSSVDLSGYTLSDGIGLISTPTGTIAGGAFFIIELSSSKLNNGGDAVVLKYGDDIVDMMCYGDWDGDACVSLAPERGESIAFYSTWQLTITPTKGEQNNITPRVVEQPESSSGGGGGASVPTAEPSITIHAGDVVINELVSDPSDDYEEFIELYNTTDHAIDLTGWWIEDGSEAKTILEGSISSHDFFIIDTPKGRLNNSGDYVVLFAKNETLVDEVTYGAWDDGRVDNNAKAPTDPYSLARITDGHDTGNDAKDFSITATITKDRPNVISQFTPEGDTVATSIKSYDMILSEIFPNPSGSDSEDEFIELYNTGSTTIDLVGWKLGDATSRKYTITQGIVEPDTYIIFKRSVTKIALNNTGEEKVVLYTNKEQIVDSVQYSGKVEEDSSYVKDDDAWVWTQTSTPEKENSITGIAAAPVIVINAPAQVAQHEVIVFDASDSTHPRGEDLSFTWKLFGKTVGHEDQLRYDFGAVGEYSIELIVTASGGEIAIDTISFYVYDPNVSIEIQTEGEVKDLIISEYMPDPEGSDMAEFIELYNPTPQDISLAGYYLDDMEGGSRAYAFPDDTIISAETYVVFDREDTKLALNNTVDAVRILDVNKKVIIEIQYEDPVEGASALWIDGAWKWSTVITPGAENVFVASIISVDKKKKTKKQVKQIIYTTLDLIRNEDKGDRVSVAGVVSALPGIFGTQYFYIASDSEASGGAQVYMHSKDFPSLSVGDRVDILGELSEAYGETRIKTKEKTDIQKRDHPGDPDPALLDIADIGENTEGQLVSISGEVTEVKTSYFYIDDGTDEVKAYIKRGPGITKQHIMAGDLMTIVGIVSQKRSGFQLLPRMQSDLIKTGVAEDAISIIEQSDLEGDKEVAEKYLTATAGGLTSLLFGLLAKIHGSSVVRFAKRLGSGIMLVARRKK